MGSRVSICHRRLGYVPRCFPVAKWPAHWCRQQAASSCQYSSLQPDRALTLVNCKMRPFVHYK